MLLNDTRVDTHHGCDRVVETLLRLARRHGIEVVATAPAHRDWRRDPEFVEALRRSRLVLVNGEGTLHHRAAAGAWLLEAGATARALGLPAALINCTWQDNGAELAARLRDFSLVCVRESASERELRAQGIGSLRVPDLSLFGPPPAPRPRSGLGYAEGFDRDGRLAALGARLSARCCPIQYAVPGVSGACRYFRSYFGRADLADPRGALRRLRQRLRQYRRQTRDGAAYLQAIAGLELLISARFHADCLALVAGTPLLALQANSHKVAGLLQDAGLEPWRLTQAEAIDPALLEQARAWTPGERSNLRDYLADGQRRLDALFAALRALA